MLRNLINLKHKVNKKIYLNNILINDFFSEIKKNDFIFCQYWLIDKYKYRILWFSGLCIKKKKKNHLSYIILKNKIWDVKILQYFYVYSPNFLNFFYKKKK